MRVSVKCFATYEEVILLYWFFLGRCFNDHRKLILNQEGHYGVFDMKSELQYYCYKQEENGLSFLS